MAISLRAAGTWAAANATTQTVTLPTHAAGDMLILRVGFKHATMPTTVTVGTAGWTKLGQHNSGTTASSNNGGSVIVAVFYKEAASAAETNPVVTYHATVAATPSAAVALSYQKGAGEVWETPQWAAGTIAAATAMSATMGTHISTTAGDMVDVTIITNDNTTLTVPTVTQTGVTFNTVVESPAAALSSATSNDIAADGAYRLASSGTSSAAAVVTGTNSVADEGAAATTRLRVTTVTTVSGSFTADAHIRKNDIAGSFTADAHIKKFDIAGSFTADAYVSKTTSGSFTADAQISAAPLNASIYHTTANDFENLSTAFADVAEIASTNFVANKKYLILVSGFVEIDSASAQAEIRVGYGTTPTIFTDGTASIDMSLTTISHVPFQFMFVHTQGGTAERYVVQARASSATFTVAGDVQITAIRLSDEWTENTDYFTNETTADYTTTATYGDSGGGLGSVTFTPNGSDAWVIFGWASYRPGVADGTSDTMLRLQDSVAGTLAEINQDGEDTTNDIRSINFMQVVVPSAASHTFRLEAAHAGTVSSTIYGSRVFALNISKFAQYGYVREVGAIDTLATAPSWTNLATISPTPDTTGNWLILSYATANHLTNTSTRFLYIRQQVNASGGGLTSLPAYGDNSPNQANWKAGDKHPIMLQTLTSMTSGAARQINLDGSISNGTGNEQFIDRNILAVPLLRAGGSAPVTGSFTADAHIKATVSGTFTADSNIKKLDIPGSFTADAYILRTWGGETTEYDTFTDTNGTLLSAHTGDTGQGWSEIFGNPSINSGVVTATTAGSNARMTGAGSNDGYASMRFNLGADGVSRGNSIRFRYSSNSDFLFAKVRRSSTPTNQIQLWRRAGGVTDGTALATVTLGAGELAADTWYELAVRFQGPDIRIYLDGVEKLATTSSFNISTAASGVCLTFEETMSTGQAVDNFRFASGQSFTADAYISATVASTFTADANVKATIAGAFTADSNIKKLDIPGTFTANANIATSVGGTFTADAYVKQTLASTFTANANIRKNDIAGNITADAYIKKLDIPGSFTADAAIGKTFSGTFTADAYVKKTISGTLTADAYVRQTFAGSVTADAYVKQTLSGSVTADAHVKSTVAGSFTADAWVQVTGTIAGSFTADANIKATPAGTFTADAYIRSTASGTFTADANIGKTTAGTFTADAFVRNVLTGSWTADAYIKNTLTGSLTADAYVKNTIGGTFTSDASILKTTSGTFTADAWIDPASGTTYTGSFTADANVKATVPGSFSADAFVRRLGNLGSFTADAYIKNTIAGSFTANAHIGKTFTGSVTADAYIQRIQTGTFLADAAIKATVSGSLTADAYISKTLSGSVTADAYIGTSTTGAFTADAYVKATASGSFVAAAWISNPNAVLRVTSNPTKGLLLGSSTGKSVVVATSTSTSATLIGRMDKDA